MDRHAEGAPDAFEEVYKLLGPRLSRFFSRRLRDGSSADDLTQQTLLKMHLHRHTFVTGSDVFPWAFTIGHRLLLDELRRRRREIVRDEPWPDDNFGGVLPDDIVMTEELRRRLQAVYENLPTAQQMAFDLVRRQELSGADAAEILGTSEAAVKQRVFRASEALREALGVERARE
jgi:RNA polymerase sigma-70 factor, ECF subfamily